MKKFIALAAILATLSTSSALAKTEGNYVGIDVLKTNAVSKSFSNSAKDADLSEYYSHNKKDSAIGIGVNYKHAFNFNNFFIAPGVFYQRLGTKANSGYSTNEYDAYNQSVNLKDRLGFKTDFGYDIANNFSAYIPVGVNFVSYDLKTSDSSEVDFGYKTLSSKHSGRKAGYFYGLGFAFSPIDKISINLEYNRLSKLRIKSVAGATILNHGTIVANTNVDVFKVGLSYNF